MLYTLVTAACLVAQSSSPPAVPAPLRTTSDDYQLFLENIVEVPRGQRKVWNGSAYNAPYKCAPLKGVPCVPCPGGVCPLPPLPRPAPVSGPFPVIPIAPK